MQKIIIISTLTAILSLPAFAEIANNATCNNTNLGQSDNNSTANIEANWNANTININWYNGNTKITSNTCTYDGSITLPAQPTKPGYTFAGWKLRAAAVLCPTHTTQQECASDNNCLWDDIGGYIGADCHYKDCDIFENSTTCEENGCGWDHCGFCTDPDAAQVMGPCP